MKGVASVKEICNGASNVAKRQMGSPMYPRWMWVALTDICNSRCSYCSIHKTTPTPLANHLTPEDLKRIFKSSLFAKTEYIINSGGEITLRKDLLECFLAEHEARPKATLQLSTNGLLPDRVIEVSKELCERGIKFEVGISLDGVGAEHDAIRGVKGNFEKVDYLIKELLKMKVFTVVGATLTGQNLPANRRAKGYADAKNIPFMYHWFNVSPFYNNSKLRDKRRNDEMVQALKSVMTDNPYRDMWIKEINGIQPHFPCYALFTFAVLKCNGDVAPCLSLWNEVVGNMKFEDPVKVWFGEKAEAERKRIKKCEGCLNSWGVGWSLTSSGYQNIVYRNARRIQKLLGRSSSEAQPEMQKAQI